MSQISELEDKINNSLLFSINEEEESDRYKNEKMRLISDIVKYVIEITNEGKIKWDFREIGLEIIESANNCIKNFDKNEGEFLHYYLTALKNKILEEKRDIKIYKFNEEIKNGKIKKDGKELSIFDILAVEDSTKIIEREDFVQKSLKDIDYVFCLCQERQQKILRPLLTSLLIEILNNDLSCKFIDKDMISMYSKDKTYKPPTQRELAKKLNRDEASISRTLNVYLKDLISYIKDGRS